MTLRIWILKDSEPLPLGAGAKPMRVAMLADALLTRGHEVHWWCSTMSHFRKVREADEGESVLPMPNGNCILHRIEAGLYRRNLSLGRILHHRRLAHRWQEQAARQAQLPDVILVAYPIIEWVRAALAFAAPRGIPVIVDVRDQWPDTFANYVPPALKPWVRMAVSLLYAGVPDLFRTPAAVTSMSTPVLRWALQKAGRPEGRDTAVFYLGTPLASRLAAARGTAQRPSAVLQCLFVGTLGHTADVMTIAEAAKILHEAGEPMHITIAGNGDHYDALREATHALPNVTMTGWCDADKVVELLSSADVALLTGHNEAMPNKFFDYVAAGLPIVCSLRGEVREVIGQRQLGVCCPSADPQALVDALKAVRGQYAVYLGHVAAVPEKEYADSAIYKEFAAFIEGTAPRS